jgi:hypothetical protein
MPDMITYANRHGCEIGNTVEDYPTDDDDNNESYQDSKQSDDESESDNNSGEGSSSSSDSSLSSDDNDDQGSDDECEIQIDDREEDQHLEMHRQHSTKTYRQAQSRQGFCLCAD